MLSVFSLLPTNLSAETELNKKNKQTTEQAPKPDLDELKRLAMLHLHTGKDSEAALSNFFRAWVRSDEGDSHQALLFYKQHVYQKAKERKLHLSSVRSLLEIAFGFFAEKNFEEGVKQCNNIQVYLFKNEHEMTDMLAYIAFYNMFKVFEKVESKWVNAKNLTNFVIDRQEYYLVQARRKSIDLDDETFILSTLIAQLRLSIRLKKYEKAKQHLKYLREYVEANSLKERQVLVDFFESLIFELEEKEGVKQG